MFAEFVSQRAGQLKSRKVWEEGKRGPASTASAMQLPANMRFTLARPRRSTKGNGQVHAARIIMHTKAQQPRTASLREFTHKPPR